MFDAAHDARTESLDRPAELDRFEPLREVSKDHLQLHSRDVGSETDAPPVFPGERFFLGGDDPFPRPEAVAFFETDVAA